MAKIEYLTEIVLATGALGTAAFGIVEGLKATAAVGEAGFDAIPELLGRPLTETLRQAHGDRWREVYRGLYRGDQAELTRLLRQGVRVGLTASNAPAIAADLFGAEPMLGQALASVATKVLDPAQTPSEAELRALGRYELAADARIDAALAIAKQRYAARARHWAMGVAFVVALGTAAVVQSLALKEMLEGPALFGTAFLIGLAAVPIAPIAKDVASGINAAVRALKARG